MAPSSNTSKKRQRADRGIKLKRRKVVKLITVKCALRCRLRFGPDVGQALDVVAKIRERVSAYSHRTVNSSLALSGIVKDLFSRDPAIPIDDADPSWIADVHIPREIFTQTFFRQLLLGTDDAVQPSQMIRRYHETHPQLLLAGHRHLGDRNIYSAGATQNLTNMKTSLRVELDDRIKAATRRLGLPKGDDPVVRYQINGWTLPPRFGCCLPLPRATEEVIALHRRMLGLSENEVINDEWLRDDSHLPDILRYSVFLNKLYQDSGSKLFNVVPICSVRSHFIRIDTSVLYGVLRDVGAIRGRQVKVSTFDMLRDVFWNDTFDFSKIKPRGSEFGWSVMTDAVSMCATFERTSEVPVTAEDHRGGGKTPVYEPLHGDIIVGNDPGRVNIFYMAGVHDGRVKVAKLSRGQYYTESGAVSARRNTERWTRGIQRVLDLMSEVSTKGMDRGAHEEYLTAFYVHSPTLWGEYTRPRWARQRMNLYGGKKRVFANFFTRLVSQFSGGRVVVAYGNAKFPSGGTGEQSVPTTRAYKECVSRVSTYSTDEFRTSKVHHQDDSILQLVASRQRPGFALRGLLYNPTIATFVSRDLNAALNIRRILIGPRPGMLSRGGGGQQRLEQAIVKRIRGR